MSTGLGRKMNWAKKLVWKRPIPTSLGGLGEDPALGCGPQFAGFEDPGGLGNYPILYSVNYPTQDLNWVLYLCKSRSSPSMDLNEAYRSSPSVDLDKPYQWAPSIDFNQVTDSAQDVQVVPEASKAKKEEPQAILPTMGQWTSFSRSTAEEPFGDIPKGHIKHRFIEVPLDASWGEATMQTSRFDTGQISPLQRLMKWESDVTFSSPSAKSFALSVEGGQTMGLAIAQFWSIGRGSQEATMVDFEIEFHGISINKNEAVLDGSKAPARIDAEASLLTQMDSLEQARRILVLAATYRPRAVEVALTRTGQSGRLDFVLKIAEDTELVTWARVQHREGGPVTKSFAIDECLSGRIFLQIVEIEPGPYGVQYDEVYSGSTCKHGEIEAVVIATGVHSLFGKVTHLVDSTEVVGRFQKVFTAMRNFCICFIAMGMILEIIAMLPIQHHLCRTDISNLLVFSIGQITIAMPTILSVTLAIGSHQLSQQGAITMRMTAIEEMAGMDVLCSNKTRTLTLDCLTVGRNLVKGFNKYIDKDTIVLLAAKVVKLESQDAMDAAIVNMLADPMEACANITEVHSFPFNPSLISLLIVDCLPCLIPRAMIVMRPLAEHSTLE